MGDSDAVGASIFSWDALLRATCESQVVGGAAKSVTYSRWLAEGQATRRFADLRTAEYAHATISKVMPVLLLPTPGEMAIGG